jgi:mannan endo-1,4-beta-mannosidase
MSLVNKTFLGSYFQQDSKQHWLKIDGVVLGENHGLATIESFNIGTILDNINTSGNGAVVVYNWSKGIAFIKSNFTLSTTSDSAINSEYTTFILKSKISQNNINFFNTQPQPQPTPNYQDILIAPYIMPGNDTVRNAINAVKGFPLSITIAFWNKGWDSGNPDDSLISDIRKNGGEPGISFGGYSGCINNLEPALQGGTIQDILQRYLLPIKQYNFVYADFDIEMEKENDSSTFKLRNAAIVLLQKQLPNLKVSFTIPSYSNGFSGKNMLLDAIHQGVKIDTIRLMLMEFGRPVDMVDTCISGIKNCKNIFDSMGLSHVKLGFIPLLMYDGKFNTYTLDNHISILKQITLLPYVTTFSYWEMAIDQKHNFDFLKAYITIKKPTPVPTPKPTPVPTPKPTPVPTPPTPIPTPKPTPLVGQVILGNTIVQDNKPNWVKIDNVTVGDTFEYTSYKSYDIGKLLDTVMIDSKVQVLLYKWDTGEAYSKTGYNFTNGSDTKLNPGFTSFIKKVKNNVPVPTPTPNPVPTPMPINSSFVLWNGINFMLNNKIFVPVGVNAYWLGLMEGQVYPSQEQITEIFKGAKTCAFTVIRSHSLGISTGNNNSLRPWNNILNEVAWKTIDWAYSEAKKYGIKLIVPLTDEYNYYHGNYNDFCKTRNVDKSMFWTDLNVRSDFKNYIFNYLNHTNQYTGIKIKDSPELFLLETGNELGQNKVRGGGSGIPSKDWISDITSYIKSIAPNIMTLDGNDESLGWSDNFNVKTTDCFSAHFYWLDKNRITYGASNAKKVGKPYIIGESSTNAKPDWYNFVENTDNIHGTLGWSFYPHDNGNKNGLRIPHGEPDYTQTLYFDNQTNDNTQYLLNISNHCRRMRNLPTVNQLTF